MGTHSPFLKLHAPTVFAVHGWHSYLVPLARIELTVPDYETGALPLSDKGIQAVLLELSNSTGFTRTIIFILCRARADVGNRTLGNPLYKSGA